MAFWNISPKSGMLMPSNAADRAADVGKFPPVNQPTTVSFRSPSLSRSQPSHSSMTGLIVSQFCQTYQTRDGGDRRDDRQDDRPGQHGRERGEALAEQAHQRPQAQQQRQQLAAPGPDQRPAATPSSAT